MSYNVLPYTYDKTGTEYNRLIVEPLKIPQSITESGLINPETESTICEIGKVIGCAEESSFNIGDDVFYNKVDRQNGEHLDTIEVTGIKCDVLYENEVWCKNGAPVGRIFVEAFSELEANDTGLIIPNEVKSVTQKGRVFAAPPEYKIKAGDLVEFRKQEQGMFSEVVLDEVPYMVLFEADIFKVNGEVAPYRMIIKVDMVAQQIKRQSTKSGIALSPLFQFMLYNLQYGEIVSIGEEAKKMYPELNPGDTVITHHSIEHQPYRLLGREFQKQKKKNNTYLSYEYRVLNCWDEKSREIFGKLTYDKRKGKIINITPLNNSVFLKWNFGLLEASSNKSALLLDDTDISRYDNLDDFRNAITHKKKEAADKAKTKTSGIRLALQTVDPRLFKDRYDELESELKTIQREETRLSFYLRKNHLVVCKRTYPMHIPSYVVTTYEELYPISLFDQKFLIAHKDFLIAQTSKNMDISLQDIQPLGVNVIIKPISEEKTTDLLVPMTAREKPQKGLVVAIYGHSKVSSGDTVLYRKSAGLEQDLDGVPHLIMTHNDLLAVLPGKQD